MNVDLEWELIKLQQLVLHSLNLGESLHKNGGRIFTFLALMTIKLIVSCV